MGGTFIRRERKHKRRAREGGDMATKKKSDFQPVAEDKPGPPPLPPATASIIASVTGSVPNPKPSKTLPAHSTIFSAATAAGLITDADTAGMSRQKRKRFEKYLLSKLRKDENVELIKAIEKEQKADAAATQAHHGGLFASLKDLGRGGNVTKREELRRELREWKAGVGSGQGLFEQRRDGVDAASDDDSESEGEEATLTSTPKPVLTFKASDITAGLGAGSGLKRPLELDENGLPMITKRSRSGGAASVSSIFTAFSAPPPTPPVQSVESQADQGDDNMSDGTWEGFSDSDADEAEPDAVNSSLTDAEVKIVKSVLKKTAPESQRTGPKKRVRWSLGDGLDSDLSDEEEEVESIDVSDSEQDSESSSGSDSDSDSDSGEYKKERKERASAFVAWATQQRNVQVGFTPSAKDHKDAQLPTHHAPSVPADFTPRAPEHDPLPAGFDTTTAAGRNRVVHAVTVDRPPAIQAARLQLPIVGEEQAIMEAINNNDVTIICGATGSGKTTQVPQFLLEAGYGSKTGPTPGMIAVTQPRRVAAVSMATRVGTELGEGGKKSVGYKIRFDGTVTAQTKIKFMTEGILLREMSDDFALSSYSAVIVDEAHERGINTDLLVGMLSRVVRLRSEQAKTVLTAKDDKDRATAISPLKVIIMSATLRTSDFADNRRLFPTVPPIVSAEGRQHSVTMHFARRTKSDYVTEMFEKLKRAQGKLPPGGILVFLTGQDEIRRLAKLLRQALPSTETHAGEAEARVNVSAADVMPEDEDVALGGRRMDISEGEKTTENDGDDDDEDVHIAGLDDSDADHSDDEFDIPDDDAETDDPDVVSAAAIFGREKPTKVHVLPLYSQLPTKLQLRVFDPPPEGARLIVLATNVAETSITIPGIRYVFDSGRSKRRLYDSSTGVQRLDIGWVSKAAASQRAGRAGRTGPGHCYRLYSSAIYEADFPQFDAPEIVGAPLEGVVLQLRALGLKSVRTFPFPTPPDSGLLVKAERLLGFLGALDRAGKVTPEGHRLAAYPLSPRLGRILLLGQAHDLAALSIAMVGALAVGEIFVPEAQAIPLNNDDDGGDDSDGDDNGDADPDSDDERAKRMRNKNRDRTSAALDGTDDPRRAYRRAHAILGRWDSTSDAIKLLTAVCAYAHAGPALPSSSSSPSSSFKTASPARTSWAEAHFLRSKSLAEVSQLRSQLTSIVRAHAPAKISPTFVDALPQPSKKQLLMIRQIVAAGFIDQIAIRADLAPLATSPLAQLPRKPRRVGEVPYLTLFQSRDESETSALKRQIAQFGLHSGHAVITDGSSTINPATAAKMASALTHFVFIHPSSVLAHQHLKSIADLPPYIVYSRLERSTGPTRVYSGFPMPARIFMHPLTPVSPAQVTALTNGTDLLEFGKPIGRVTDLDPLSSLPGGAGGDDKSSNLGASLPDPRREAWVVPTLVGRDITAVTGVGTGAGSSSSSTEADELKTVTGVVVGLPARAREWALPARRVIQRKDRVKGWVVEQLLEGVGTAMNK